MRKKALLAIGAAATMALAASAGTYALFTAQTNNSHNTFTAGTLSLSSWRDQGDTIPGPMFYTTTAEGQTPSGLPGRYPTGPWAPGDARVRVLMVKNSGSLDAWLTSVGADLESGSMALANKMRYCISTYDIIPFIPSQPNAQQPLCPTTEDPAVDPNVTHYIAIGNLGDLITNDKDFTTKLSSAVGSLTQLHFYVDLPLDADNSYQNLPLQVTFSVSAVQKKNNP